MEKKTIRFNLELTPDALKRVTELQELDEAPSKTEVFRRALRLYAKVIEHCAKGGSVIFEHPNQDRERLMIL